MKINPILLCVVGLLIGISLGATKTNALDRRLKIINKSNHSICAVHITHRDRDDWGQNLLENSTGRCISPGQNTIVNPGYQDGYCMMHVALVLTRNNRLVEFIEPRLINICAAVTYTLLQQRIPTNEDEDEEGGEGNYNL